MARTALLRAREHGFSPAQWALGKDIQLSGHSNRGPGEDIAIGTAAILGTDLHASMQLRKRAEQALREQREKDLASCALNARPVEWRSTTLVT